MPERAGKKEKVVWVLAEDPEAVEWWVALEGDPTDQALQQAREEVLQEGLRALVEEEDLHRPQDLRFQADRLAQLHLGGQYRLSLPLAPVSLQEAVQDLAAQLHQAVEEVQGQPDRSLLQPQPDLNLQLLRDRARQTSLGGLLLGQTDPPHLTSSLP